jgi:hypothetical protein
MSTNFLPKSVFKGTNSDGSTFIAREYDFETFALFEVGNFFAFLLVGGLFCAILSPIILVMIMLTFTGRFNFLYLLIYAFSGYFVYDCANGWLFSLFLNIFIDTDGLIFLTCVNIACMVIITILTFFGRTIINIINAIAADEITRYVIFFIITGIAFYITYKIANSSIDTEWLGVTQKIKELNNE